MKAISKSAIDILDKRILVTAFLSVFLIHGEMLFKKLSWYDDLGITFSGNITPVTPPMIHGRFFYHWLVIWRAYLSGPESLPAVYGAIGAIFMALMVNIIIKQFQIEKSLPQFAFVLIFVSIPAVAGHFGYMESSIYDFFGAFLCVLSGYIICRNDVKVSAVQLSACILAFSIGEYQCYITFFLTIALVHFIGQILKEKYTWADYFKKALCYVGTGIIGIIFYLVILKINLAITSLKLASYAGTDTFGITSFAGYLQRIADAYSDFFVPNIEAEYCMFPFHFAGWHRILLASMILSAVILMILLVKNGYAVSAFQFMLALVLLPAAINFNMILYDKQNMHSLHQYHLCMLFVLWYILARTLSLFWKEGIFRKISSCMCSFTAVVYLIFGCLCIRYDNCCYMLAEFRHQRVTVYYTTLITRIQSLDGYNPGSPVVISMQGKR